jgi:hypothetical protein
MLTGFTRKTNSMGGHGKQREIQAYNNLVFDWDIDYQGYQRNDGDIPEGYIDFHLVIEIVEAIIKVRDEKTNKKVKRPGYKLTAYQNIVYPERQWQSYIIYDEEFKKEHLNKAFDVFQREVLNVQDWIAIAESRACLIPENKEAFECMFCGWVTDRMADDITCHGCGKRFWSEKIWSKRTKDEPKAQFLAKPS